jgi:hypothetical protein
MKNETLFLIPKSGYDGTVQSTVHNDHVDFSGSLYNSGKDNLTVEEYSKLKNTEYQVLTWNELEPMIRTWQDKNILKDWKEVSKETFYEMFEVLPPIKYAALEKGFAFAMSEYLTDNITAHYVTDGEKYYMANRRILDKWETLLLEITMFKNTRCSNNLNKGGN